MKRMRMLGLGLVAAFVVSAVAAVGASAQPTGDFAVFKACPLNNAAVALCFVAESSSGHFTIGSKTVKFKKLKLQGGSIVNEETGAETFVGPENGEETLTKTVLKVPGGLSGIKFSSFPEPLKLRWREPNFDRKLELFATIELVGKPGISRSNLLNQEGTALELPIRIRLTNNFRNPEGKGLLSEECFIGSPAEPIVQHLTSGTSGAITGKVGELEFNEAFTFVIVRNNLVVDGTYPVPASTGCGGANSAIVNSEISRILELPRATEQSTTEIEGTLFLATAEGTRNSEK